MLVLKERNSNNLIIVSRRIISKAKYGREKFIYSSRIFQRGKRIESPNGRVPQKREMILNGVAKDAIARANTQIRNVNIVQNIRIIKLGLRDGARG
jgi:hypothetical protein